jgi:hypothetical protein
MKVSTEIKADILKTLMLEARREVRDIRSAINKNMVLLTGFSFALSSFLLEKQPSLLEKQPSLVRTYICLMDLLIIILLWVIYLVLFYGLLQGRKVLNGQEDKIIKLKESDTADESPFADAGESESIWCWLRAAIVDRGTDLILHHHRKRDCRDCELWLFPIISTGLIAVKMWYTDYKL